MSAADEPPAPPDLALLEDLDCTVVDEGAFERDVDGEASRRRVLRGYVEADGWSWSEVHDTPDEARGRVDRRHGSLPDLETSTDHADP